MNDTEKNLKSKIKRLCFENNAHLIDGILYESMLTPIYLKSEFVLPLISCHFLLGSSLTVFDYRFKFSSSCKNRADTFYPTFFPSFFQDMESSIEFNAMCTFAVQLIP